MADPYDDLDITNDPEIERLGANVAATYALWFWKKISRAARADASLLDPLWSWQEDEESSSTTVSAHHTTKIQFTESAKQDDRLYKRFRSNFGGFPVQHFKSSKAHNPLVSETWSALLLASEGVVQDFNFMTLLRADCQSMFWMSEEEVCEGLLVVPRAQFLFIELARCKEGLYGREFRRALQVFEIKTVSDALQEAFDEKNMDSALQNLQLLRTQWTYPRPQTLRTTGIVTVLKQGAALTGGDEDDFVMIRDQCSEILKRWYDIMELGRLGRDQFEEWTPNQQDALVRAAQALASSSNTSTTVSKLPSSTIPNGKSSKTSGSAVTKTTSSVDDLIITETNNGAAADLFRDYGIAIIPNAIEAVQPLREQAASALNDLIMEQLEPRGLEVDGEEAFDFAEVRQRPGHRVDNRYHILEPADSPIAKLSRRLLHELPRRLFPNEIDSNWQLLYAGVVHSWPRKKADDPIPEAQIWHRDGPSLFTDHHATHCLNVFVPLVDVSTENGATEFIAGTHDDRLFNDVAGDVIITSQQDPAAQHELAVRPSVAAGTVIAFDIRVMHRGLANASMEERPVLYFTMARDFFREKHMFQEESIVQQPDPRDEANQHLCLRLYQSVTGRRALPKETIYGHPHYTTRFDLLLLEQFRSNDIADQADATTNVSAILSFASLPPGDKDALCRDFCFALNEDAVEQKLDALEQARRKRKETREQGETEDFGSISTDMSDVTVLYEMTARIILQDTTLMSTLGFTVNEAGLCTAAAMLKAYATYSELGSLGVSAARLEESLTNFWHCGTGGRFEFIPGSAESPTERSNRSLLVVFSSLGSGIARPEWRASTRNVSSKPDLDVLHVLDPAFSWYCQDPTCEWKGCEYYLAELRCHIAGYRSVYYLGDSMGAAAALRFSSLADKVLAFTPQVDISQYEAITRTDFTLSVKKDFQRELILAVKNSKAKISIHYGRDCEEDVQQVRLLPQRDGVTLVEHEFDDHILSLHLREEGLLTNIVEEFIMGRPG